MPRVEEPGDPPGEPQPLLRNRLTPAQWLAVDAGAAVAEFVAGAVRLDLPAAAGSSGPRAGGLTNA